jgi:hypothetical protein
MKWGKKIPRREVVHAEKEALRKKWELGIRN